MVNISLETMKTISPSPQVQQHSLLAQYMAARTHIHGIHGNIQPVSILYYCINTLILYQYSHTHLKYDWQNWWWDTIIAVTSFWYCWTTHNDDQEVGTLCMSHRCFGTSLIRQFLINQAFDSPVFGEATPVKHHILTEHCLLCCGI